MKQCLSCGMYYAVADAMKSIVDASELLVDAANLGEFSETAVAAAGEILVQRVEKYRETVDEAARFEEGEQHAVS